MSAAGSWSSGLWALVPPPLPRSQIHREAAGSAPVCRWNWNTAANPPLAKANSEAECGGGGNKEVNIVRFSPDGDVIACGSQEGKLKVYQTSNLASGAATES